MVGRFVQQQKVRRVQQHTQQGIAAALSAGEHSDFLEDVVFGEEKTSQQAAQLGLRGPRRHVAEIVNHAGVGIEFFVLVLGKVVSLNIVSKPELAAGERLRAREQLDEGRFTCSVHTYKCDPVAAFDHETDVAEDLFLFITFRHIFELGHNAAAGLRLRLSLRCQCSISNRARSAPRNTRLIGRRFATRRHINVSDFPQLLFTRT